MASNIISESSLSSNSNSDDESSSSSTESEISNRLESLVIDRTDVVTNGADDSHVDAAEASITCEVKGANKEYIFERTYPSMLVARQGILDKEIGGQLEIHTRQKKGIKYAIRVEAFQGAQSVCR